VIGAPYAASLERSQTDRDPRFRDRAGDDLASVPRRQMGEVLDHREREIPRREPRRRGGELSHEAAEKNVARLRL